MTDLRLTRRSGRLSHPSRVRGLKFHRGGLELLRLHVAPFTGAWIEMLLSYNFPATSAVATFTGAWIEIRPARRA